MRRSLAAIAIVGSMVAAATIAASPNAEARVFVGVGVGVPVYYPPPPVYYYPPPPQVYYAPPPVVYTPAPPPVYTGPLYAAPQQGLGPTVTPPPPQTGNCRQFQGDATIDGRNQPFHGTACLQPDGKWHIVN
jgi:hypothetical protein